MTPTVGSPALLLQLTTNLVHNAIVHNLPDEGTVWVTTSVHPKRAVLTVENTGEKLTPQFVSTLVEPFRRGTERIRTDHAGIGLGLAIVKSITEAHDGTLTLTPRAVAGSASRCNPAAPPPATSHNFASTDSSHRLTALASRVSIGFRTQPSTTEMPPLSGVPLEGRQGRRDQPSATGSSNNWISSSSGG